MDLDKAAMTLSNDKVELQIIPSMTIVWQPFQKVRIKAHIVNNASFPWKGLFYWYGKTCILFCICLRVFMHVTKYRKKVKITCKIIFSWKCVH